MLMKTKRLTLRSIEETDLQAIAAILANEVVSKTYMVPDIASWEDALKIARRFYDAAQDDRRVVLGIDLDDRLIGVINDVEQQRGAIEFGFAIHPDYHNRGYMTEAFEAVIGEMFRWGYETVVAGAFAENKASLRVMHKCGMRRVTQKEYITYRGEAHECVYYVAANPDPNLYGDVMSYGGIG